MGHHRGGVRRYLRGLRAYVVANRRTVAVDVVVLTGWTLLLLLLAIVVRAPRELVYAGVLAGVVSYSLVAKWHDGDASD